LELTVCVIVSLPLLLIFTEWRNPIHKFTIIQNGLLKLDYAHQLPELATNAEPGLFRRLKEHFATLAVTTKGPSNSSKPMMKCGEDGQMSMSSTRATA